VKPISEKVKVVKSPLVPRRKSSVMNVENIIFNVTLPNGMIVTNPNQFCGSEMEENNESDNDTNKF
jgi:hypothetical protein